MLEAAKCVGDSWTRITRWGLLDWDVSEGDVATSEDILGLLELGGDGALSGEAC